MLMWAFELQILQLGSDLPASGLCRLYVLLTALEISCVSRMLNEYLNWSHLIIAVERM